MCTVGQKKGFDQAFKRKVKRLNKRNSAYEVELIGRVFYKSNRGAGCQSAGSQIDPISFILQSGGYLSCAPENLLHSCHGE